MEQERRALRAAAEDVAGKVSSSYAPHRCMPRKQCTAIAPAHQENDSEWSSNMAECLSPAAAHMLLSSANHSFHTNRRSLMSP